MEKSPYRCPDHIEAADQREIQIEEALKYPKDSRKYEGLRVELNEAEVQANARAEIVSNVLDGQAGALEIQIETVQIELRNERVMK